MIFRIGIDISGTFTDLVAITADGSVRTHTVASTPHDFGEGIMNGIQALLARNREPVTEVLHATTVGSNTVLEANGARTALITTRGFRDILEIRDLRMPVLYDQHWTKPLALVERRLRLEVTEKLRPDGSVSVPLDPASVAAAIDRLRAEEVESVAIFLLHSYANPANERAVADAMRAALPNIGISVSSEILPEIKEYPRTSTTVINAYVQPVVRAYITALDAKLRALGVTAPLQLMQSNDGLASAAFTAAAPAHIIESGPAAGVVGAAALVRRLNEPGIINFDMGGTTAKAGLVENGEVIRTEAIEVGGGVMPGSRFLVGAGYMLKLPAIDLAEVGAGGGSICRLDEGGAPKVGPQGRRRSRAGLLRSRRRGAHRHRLQSGTGLSRSRRTGRRCPEAGSRCRRGSHRARLGRSTWPAGRGSGVGMLRLASATMMQVIRAVSVERGRDPRKFALLAFGGNGPLFAAGIAQELGIERVLVPPLPGVFSAFGLLVADTEHHASQSLRIRLDAADPARITAVLVALAEAGAAQLTRDGFAPNRQTFTRSAQARYLGQSSEIDVPLPDGAVSPTQIAALFGEQLERIYGFRAPPEEKVELIGLSGMARGLPERPRLPDRIPPLAAAVPPAWLAWFPGDGWIDTPVVHRAGLGDAARDGPFIVQEYDATCLVPRGACAWLDGFGNVVMHVGASAQKR